MRVVRSRTVLGAIVLAAIVAREAAASLQGPSECLASKNKCVSENMQRKLSCHDRAERTGRAVDSRCLERADDKYDGGAHPTTGCFAKLESKHDRCSGGTNDGAPCAVDSECPGGTCTLGCVTRGDATVLETAVDDFVEDVVTDLDPGFPTPVRNACSAGKKKCILKRTAAILKCHEKAVRDGVALDPLCLAAANDKYDGASNPANGCFAKLEARGPCLAPEGDANALAAKVDAFVRNVLCELGYRTGAELCDTSACMAGKNQCVSENLQRKLECHNRAERRGRAVDPLCMAAANQKYDGGHDPAQGCFAKVESKHDLCDGGANEGAPCAIDSECPGGVCAFGCLTRGDAPALATMLDEFIDDVVTDLDPGYPTPARNACSAGKKKCVQKKAAAILKCHEKAVKNDVAIDPVCIAKAQAKFDGGAHPNRGCFAKLEARGQCLAPNGDANAVGTKVDGFVQDVLCQLGDADACRAPCVGDCPVCGDGQKSGTEPCDPSDPTPANQVCQNSGNGLEDCTGCVCHCPGHFDFIADATDPATILDAGWTGVFHDQRIITGAKITVASTGCESSEKPCGVCGFSGPVPNVAADAGDIDNHRCTNDTSIKCSTNAPCSGGGGTCEFYAGTPLPLSAGGVGACVVNRLSGSVTGTVDTGTGEVEAFLHLTSKVHDGVVEHPCPRCIGDVTPNDGVADGTCDAGTKIGLSCDVNGSSPVALFGTTSLDCPPTSSTGILEIPLTASTGTESRSLSAASPNCRALGFTAQKCFCDTCNDMAATACSSNADCVAVGATICGGKRCLLGANDGSPCSTNSECPSGGCGIPGTATRPNKCDDGACTPTSENEGECAAGPIDVFCEPNATMYSCLTQADCDAASVRSCQGGTNDGAVCSSDSECPGGNVCSGLNAGDPNTGCCLDLCMGIKTRECFTDNGVIGQSIAATGAAEVPAFEMANPTFAAIGCLQPTNAAAQNTTAGLAGPLRLTIHGLGRGLP
jgi:hypothetical protein